MLIECTAQLHDPTNSLARDASGRGNNVTLDGPTKDAGQRGYTFDGINDRFTNMVALPATYTVVALRQVAGIYSVLFENVNTFWTAVSTAAGFTGRVLALRLYPFTLTAIQQNDERISLMKQINFV